jgi:hypothetical protein
LPILSQKDLYCKRSLWNHLDYLFVVCATERADDFVEFFAVFFVITRHDCGAVIIDFDYDRDAILGIFFLIEFPAKDGACKPILTVGLRAN